MSFNHLKQHIKRAYHIKDSLSGQVLNVYRNFTIPGNQQGIDVLTGLQGNKAWIIDKFLSFLR